MSYKVCILAAGPSRRVGDFSDHVNKAVLPVNFKAVISYIIEKFPKNVEIVIAVGHRKDTIIEYLSHAHADRKFTYVEIDPYIGPGTGPGKSLLTCKNALQSPFILCTADTIVTEDIPPPETNWFGIAPVAPEDTDRYCTVKITNGTVEEITDKVHNTNTAAFIGLAGIHDYSEFFEALEHNATVIKGEIQVSNGFQAILPRQLQAKQFTWFDTGTVEGFAQANHHFATGDAFDFSKANEFLYFVGNKVIKFFADDKIIENRVKRARVLVGLTPNITHATKHFYSYDLLPGKVVYDMLTPSLANEFFNWARQELWKRRTLDAAQQREFDNACRKFYKDKSLERIEKFYAKTGLADVENLVNGKRVPPLKSLLARIDWEYITRGVPGGFHGDLQFDNVLVVNGAQGRGKFALLDWRQDFGGHVEYGDIYYDLAKLYGGLIISYKLIKQNKFSAQTKGVDIDFDMHSTEELERSRELLEEFIVENNYDLRKVRILTSMIYLNMSPLHHAPFDILLYHLGRLMLHNSLSEMETAEQKEQRQMPLLCIGPMSKTIVDTIVDFSHEKNLPMCLIASRSQVETRALGGGYANNWTTEDFAAYVRDKLKEKPAKVLICRDHGGPWLGADEKELSEKHAMLLAKASFEADIAAGFNMIHIDTSVNPGGFDMEKSLTRAFELFLFCEEKAKQYGTTLNYEIGTEDADGGVVEPDVFEEYLKRIVAFCEQNSIAKPKFIVARTGTYVREMRQMGAFDYENTKRLLDIASKYGVGIKEHNTDYDTAENHRIRAKLGVTALNIAPEFGVIETNTILQFCKKKGRHDLHERFIELAYSSKKWKKWLCYPDFTTKEQKAIIAGHYVFGTAECQQIKAELGPELDEEIRKAVWEKLSWYHDNLSPKKRLDENARQELMSRLVK
jgi:choline kinase